MKLDRNITKPRRGKYALIKLRGLKLPFKVSGDMTLVPLEAIDYGDTEDSDFFVIRLKDKYAHKALGEYGKAARADDPEYANEIAELALLSVRHRNKRKPD